MRCYITSCFAGFLAFSDDLVLLDYELFPRNKISSRLLDIQDGVIVKEEETLLKRMVKKYDVLVIEKSRSVSNYHYLKNSDKFIFESPNPGGEYLRSNLITIIKDIGFLESEIDYNSLINPIYIKIVQEKIRRSSESEDKLLIQAVNTIDELDESISKLSERIREWYSIHFPEMDSIKSHEYYVSLIAEHGHRETIIKQHRNFGLNNNLSMGAEIDEKDILIIKNFASSLKLLQDFRKSLEKYLENKMTKIAPNLKDICGATLGAKLIAHAGSIKKLSNFPSSTVQIIGAEKALFRHLKTGERPPKHGIIYQHPSVRGANWWLRGKLARALAAKISLAVRKDIYSGKFDPHLKEQLNIKLEKIKKENPFPKRQSKTRIKSDDRDFKKQKRQGKKKTKKKRNKSNFFS